ncbi:hypothetical protein [Portibacter lacus]|uniref:Tetratricopeptide repeat protein n=1 Tax=Portibacter lacus TaxID=1099794 RepID=A0AA37SR40_9BACT|nr:hypothetical protein [Portibacter lacus]GLR16130.1 hypothetical protein GCM10007940_07450 [Portibacter lacus]
MKKDNKLDKVLASEFSEDVLDLKDKLNKITGSQSAEKKKSKLLTLILPIVSIAAVFLLAIIFLPSLLDGNSAKEVYAAYYEPYPMALNQRGDSEQSLNDAINDYTSKKFESAAQKFKILYTKDGNNVFLLYAANAEQAMGNYQSAIDLYDQIIVNNDPKVTEQASWYKSLALIKLDRKVFAREILSSLSENHYKYEEAQAILKSL